MKKTSAELVFCDPREIRFYEETLIITSVDATGYVALRPIVEALGLDWNAQYRQIQRHEIFSTKARSFLMPDANGRQRKMLFLPIDFLSGWLFRINPDKVRPELLDKFIRYRKECFTFLRRESQAEMALVDRGVSHSSIAVLEQIRQMGLTIAHEAEQQIQREQRLRVVEGSLHMPYRMLKAK